MVVFDIRASQQDCWEAYGKRADASYPRRNNHRRVLSPILATMTHCVSRSRAQGACRSSQRIAAMPRRQRTPRRRLRRRGSGNGARRRLIGDGCDRSLEGMDRRARAIRDLPSRARKRWQRSRARGIRCLMFARLLRRDVNGHRPNRSRILRG